MRWIDWFAGVAALLKHLYAKFYEQNGYLRHGIETQAVYKLEGLLQTDSGVKPLFLPLASDGQHADIGGWGFKRIAETDPKLPQVY